MCRFKSGIILKDRVFIPDYDSHTDMLEELKIADTEDNAKRLFVRAELVPPDDDVFTPVSSWKYHVDQDILPDWYVTEVDEMRMREAVTEWAKEHIHIGEKIERIDSGTHWIKDCKVGNICGSAEVRRIYGSAEVGYIYDSAKVRCIYGSAKVGNIYDSAKVGNICNSAEVGNICGSAEVRRIYGSAKVGNICGSAEVRCIYGSAEVGYIYDSAKVRCIYGSAKVGNIYDSAKVGNICNSAEVGNICGSAKVGNICGSAEVENIYGSAEVGYICDSAIIETAKYYTWEHIKSVCIKDEAVLIDRYNNKIYHSGAFETVIVGGKKDE